MITHRITINMDNKCSKCGKAGAIEENKAGLCIDCIAKIMNKKRAAETNQRKGMRINHARNIQRLQD